MYKRILVPDDGSATARKALNTAISIAKESTGQIRLLHLLDELPYMGYGPYGSYYPELLESLREAGQSIQAEGMALVQSASVPVDCLLVEQLGAALGDVTAKAAADWQADLIVVGTHGRRGVGRLFLGSGAEQIIRMAPVPVLVIRADVAADSSTV